MRFVPFFAGTFLFVYIPIAAQSELKYPEYEQQLSEQLNRDQKFREQIADEQALIANYKEEIRKLKERVLELKQRRLSLFGTSDSVIVQTLRNLKNYLAELTTINTLPGRQLLQSSARCDTLRIKLDAISTQPLSRLTAVSGQLKKCMQLLDTIKQNQQVLVTTLKESEDLTVEAEKKPPVSLTDYTVSNSSGNPETLFKIAKKVYGDPNRWPEIYKANREVLDRRFKSLNHSGKKNSITNPYDLILPGQVLVIPR